MAVVLSALICIAAATARPARPLVGRRAAHVRMADPTPPRDGPDDTMPRTQSSWGAAPDVPPQLARSRALASEGLEGLPKRASQLLILGATFWLGLPALVALLVSLGVSASLYSSLGERFIHGGTPAGRRGSLTAPAPDASQPLGTPPPSQFRPEGDDNDLLL